MDVCTETRDLRPGWIMTFTGKHFFPLAPDPRDVDPEDIAHHLALKQRFTGGCRVPYSIAEHCCRVEDRVSGASPDVRLAALLHDCGEYVLPDVAAPVKNDMLVRLPSGAVVPFAEAERHVRLAIFEALGLGDFEPLVDSPLVHAADRCLCATEARDLMHGTASWASAATPLPTTIEPWGWQKAEREYLHRLRVLLDEVVR